ncbi:MAG: 2-dehydro-3-deoxygalactonokinase [Mucilaginibacter sp.]
MDKFLSCDWGTSAFRLRLVALPDLHILAEEKNDNGIAKTFRLWQQHGSDAANRTAFYYAVIAEAVDAIARQRNQSLAGIPIIVSGMASASIGLMDIPYAAAPIATDGSNLAIKKLLAPHSENELFIVSGIRTDDDVIRGEETKVVGCAPYFVDNEPERLVIFPGTHPKHVIIRGGNITSIKTSMTGEFFDLLTTQSVLAASVEKAAGFDRSTFTTGVIDSLSGNLLQAAFKVRTNDLLKHMPKADNYNYLSGLLIGYEIKGLIEYKHPIYLCGSGNLAARYQLAADKLGIPIRLQIDADEALLLGQRQILKLL